MGGRALEVSAVFLVEFLKNHDGAQRNFTVEHPLPDDAHIESYNFQDGVFYLWLESREWDGYGATLTQPVVTVHYQDQGDT